MFPLSYDGNAPIFQNDPFFAEIHSFSTMAYEYDKDVLPLQYQNLLVYQEQPLRTYESTVADTVQEGSNCRQQAAAVAAQECSKKTTYIAEKQILKKKPAKKDRHSKIYTAQGPRDRRMRMSLDVAKQFFALQDMLGFNKASKTVEWLLIQAKDEIIKLAGGGFPHLNQSCSNGPAKSASSTSESCEVVSGNDDSKQQNETSNVNTEEKSLASLEKGKKRVKRQRKTAFQQVGKESREKARKRARERTKEKMRSRRLNELNICDAIVNQECSSCSPFEGSARSHNTFEEVMLAEAEVLEPSYNKHVEEMDDDPILIMGNWSPSLVFNYLQNIN